MRLIIVLAVAAFVAAELEEPWVETDEGEEPYSEQSEDDHEIDPKRTRRDLHEEYQYEKDFREYEPESRSRREARDQEFNRRCCDDLKRVRRDTEYEYVRVPRQVHQYEVHEFNDEAAASPPPYEEMLAASADHYHRVYAAPGAPSPVHYLNPDGSPVSAAYGARPAPTIQFAPVNPPRTIAIAEPPQKLVNVPNHHGSAVPIKTHDFKPVSVPLSHQGKDVPNSYHYQNLNPEFKPVVTLQHQQTHSPQPNIPINHSSQYKPVHQPVQSLQHEPNVVPVQFVSPNPEGPSFGPVGVKSEPEVPVARLSDGDLLGSPAGHAHQHHHHHKHVRGHSVGGGNTKHAGHHAAKGGKSVKGFKTHEHVDKGSKGVKSDEHHRKEYEEAAGKKKKHHDEANHKGGHKEEAHGHRGAHFDEKKGHKKGHKTKGYHNKYHKDEFHKEHKFYDDFHKSGEHHRFGKFHAKHASNESGKKKAHHVNAGHDFVERGKKGYSNKGHLDADHKGYKGKHGHEEHHEHHKNHGKKGGSEGGKEWGYSKKN